MSTTLSAGERSQFVLQAGVWFTVSGTCEVFIDRASTVKRQKISAAEQKIGPFRGDANVAIVATDIMTWEIASGIGVVLDAAGNIAFTADQVGDLGDLGGAGGAALVGTTDTEGTVERAVGFDDYNVFKHFTVAQQADALTGTPATDTATLIQAAIDAAATAGKRCVAYGTFKVGAKIIFKGDADFSQATFKVYSTPTVAVEVSSGNAIDPTTYLTNKIVKLPKRIENMTKPATGWAAQGIGVRAVNNLHCEVHVGNVVNFTRGFLATAYNELGCNYNDFVIGHLENNQINLDLDAHTSGTAALTGVVNENTFRGRFRLSHYTGEGTAVAGTRQIRFAKSTSVVNNNLMIRPSIEGDAAEYHVENGGAYNTLLSARWEATTPKVLYSGDNANQGTYNLILGGYGVQNIVYSFTGTGGYNNRTAAAGVEIANSGFTQKLANQNSSAGAIQQFFETATRPETAAAGDWSVFHGAQSLQGKIKADTEARVKINYVTGRIAFGGGGVAPTQGPGAFGASSASWLGILYPDATNTYSIGSASYRWNTSYINNLVMAPAASVTPAANGDVTFEFTSNTELKIKAKGSDGTVRAVSLTLV